MASGLVYSIGSNASCCRYLSHIFLLIRSIFLLPLQIGSGKYKIYIDRKKILIMLNNMNIRFIGFFHKDQLGSIWS